MTSFLLDSNLLLALFSQEHKSYEAASQWFANNASEGWATCTTGEADYARVFSNKSYSLSPVSVSDALSLLKKAKQLPHYSFHSEPFNCLTNPEYADLFGKIRNSEQISGACMVATAKYNGSLLATLDEKLAGLYPEHTVLVDS